MNEEDIKAIVDDFNSLPIQQKLETMIRNQVEIINFLSNNSNKEEPLKFIKSSSPREYYWVTKYNPLTEEYVTVGRVKLDGKGIVQMWDTDLKKHFSHEIRNASGYCPEWFYVESDKDGHTYTEFEPSNEIIQVFDNTKRCKEVTGYLTDDGKIVYYDQYLVDKKEN